MIISKNVKRIKGPYGLIYTSPYGHHSAHRETIRSHGRLLWHKIAEPMHNSQAKVADRGQSNAKGEV